MKNSVSSLVLTLLCITLAVLVALFGINALNIGGVLEEDTISKGLDLVGGSSITFKAVPEENSEISMDDAIEKAINILRKRLDGLNYNEATVAKVGQDQIRIEIPGIENPAPLHIPPVVECIRIAWRWDARQFRMNEQKVSIMKSDSL